MDDCIFCKIVNKDIPSNLIYEDPEVMAFLDINPNNHGHTQVISKDHFENLYVLPGETLCRMMLTVQKLAIAIREATEADGINIVMNNEKAADQEVLHAHIHIIPRHQTDSFPHFPHTHYTGNEAKDLADKIKSSLDK